VAYNPAVADSGVGTTHGMFDLNIRRVNQPSQTNLVGAVFQIAGNGTAAWGDAIDLAYRIENRGSMDFVGPINVEVRLSTDNRITGSDTQ
jgi:hypothetical protein